MKKYLKETGREDIFWFIWLVGFCEHRSHKRREFSWPVEVPSVCEEGLYFMELILSYPFLFYTVRALSWRSTSTVFRVAFCKTSRSAGHVFVLVLMYLGSTSKP
jgi:hypothetical protein